MDPIDPNKTLRDLRQLVADTLALSDGDESELYVTPGQIRMADLFRGLDQWLSSGASLPSSWSEDIARDAAMWSGPVVDSVLDVEVDGTLNIMLVMPASSGVRGRSVTLSDVDQLHAQLEEARIFARGQQELGVPQVIDWRAYDEDQGRSR